MSDIMHLYNVMSCCVEWTCPSLSQSLSVLVKDTPADLLIISQHWVRLWLGAVKYQAIAWSNGDEDLWILSPHNTELTKLSLKQIWRGHKMQKHVLSRSNPCIMRTLQLHHNELYGVSNHRCLHCLLNWFRRRLKKTSKLRVSGLCAGTSPVTGEFPAQNASNTENISILWRHHELSTDFYRYYLRNYSDGLWIGIRLQCIYVTAVTRIPDAYIRHWIITALCNHSSQENIRGCRWQTLIQHEIATWTN